MIQASVIAIHSIDWFMPFKYLGNFCSAVKHIADLTTQLKFLLYKHSYRKYFLKFNTRFFLLLGAPQECAMYGGDYIFLRNTRCGRRIAQYIGDTDEIPARPWPHDTFHLTPVLSVNIEEEAGEVEETDAMEEIRDIEDIKSKGTEESIVLSNVSSTELRHYFQSEHKTQARVESQVIPSVQDVLESDQGNVMTRWDSQSAFVAKLMNTKRKNFG